MKKKYLALLLAASMIVGTLAGCGSSTTTTESSAPAETTVEESAAAEETAAESTEASTEAATEEAAASGEHGPSSEAAPAWEDYDARIDQIRVETDLAAREALMHEAEDELMSTFCGSTLYCAPECLSQQEYDGRASDVWSLGVILFSMVTGDNPWKGANMAQMVTQIKTGNYTVPDSLSDACRELITRARAWEHRNTITGSKSTDDISVIVLFFHVPRHNRTTDAYVGALDEQQFAQSDDEPVESGAESPPQRPAMRSPDRAPA